MSEAHVVFVYNDGGRKAAGYKGRRLLWIAIAAQLPYQQVYDRCRFPNATQRKSKHGQAVPISLQRYLYQA